MMFGEATAIRGGSDGTFEAEIQPGWDVGGNANGGYLLAFIGRAMCAATDRPDPLTVTAHYLKPGRPGPVVIDTETVAAGRSMATVRAMMRAGDHSVIAALGRVGDLSTLSGPTAYEFGPTELPSPDDCVRLEPRDDGTPPSFMSRLDLRMHPDDVGFATGRPSGRRQMRGWLRFADDEPMDPFALLFATDAFPPAVFNGDLPVAWVPTVELTAHIRSRPAPGWLRCEFTSHFVAGGLLEEDSRIWDADDQLVAQSRQLALVPRAG